MSAIWPRGRPKIPRPVELPFKPARVVMQDFTGVPCVVDLAAMRDAVKRLGGDPKKINPLVPVDLVIDHSVQVDYFGTELALMRNAQVEFERNGERYEFLRWGAKAFDNFRVVPPSTGIIHQVNLEYLAQGVLVNARTEHRSFPDTLVGTDSHTTMINGLGVLGWGVGGIEAEAVMLGQPLIMVTPQVIGFKLFGALREGVTATDLVLTVTQMLRKKGVVDKFVEFYGPGLSSMSLPDRATIANMAPEYGATCGFFPTDDETLRYLRLTGRGKSADLLEGYAKAQGLFRTDDTPDPVFTDTLELDLGTVEPSLAGPKRPQDRVALKDLKATFRKSLVAPVKDRGYGLPEAELGRQVAISDMPSANQPWSGCHRGDHILHQHQQPVGDAGRGPARQESRRGRLEGQTLRQDQPRAWLQGRDRVFAEIRHAAVSGATWFQRRGFRLHDVHRQQRPVARAGVQSRDRRQPGRPAPSSPAIAILKAACIRWSRRTFWRRRRWSWRMRWPARRTLT